ncbi:hypothetical protein NW844_08850, partial [Synechococcus sp. H55.2]|uniref:hypothetical protein n=1 Tax=unclassified Synechococcus TaxID=2626047 RepID=UPI0039C18FBC
ATYKTLEHYKEGLHKQAVLNTALSTVLRISEKRSDPRSRYLFFRFSGVKLTSRPSGSAGASFELLLGG